MATAGAPQFGHHLECSICIETYSLAEHLPKTIPCGHTFCNMCLENLNIDGRITCPNCKKQHTVPVEGVQGFITNHAITGMLEFSCAKCQNYSKTSRCPHCPLQLCTICIEDHIQSDYKPSVKASLDHNLESIQQITRNLPVFVDKANTIAAKCRIFCEESEAIMQNCPDIDSLAQIHETSKTNAVTLGVVNKVLVMDISDLGQDPPCCTDITPAAGAPEQSWKPMTPAKPTRRAIPPPPANPKPPAKPTSPADPTRRATPPPPANPKPPAKPTSPVNPMASSHVHNIQQSTVNAVLLKEVLNISDDLIPDLLQLTSSYETSQMTVTNDSVPRLVWGTKGSGPGELDHPWAAAVDAHSGNIHVADGWNKRICVYDRDGGFKSEYDVGCRPRDLCFTTEGDIAITFDDNNVKIYDVSGNVKHIIERKGEKVEKFSYPIHITRDNEGLLYVCDSKSPRVQVMDQTGSVVRLLNTSGHGNLEEPSSISVHPQTGHVYMSDKENDQVKIYSKDGQFESSIGKDDIPGVIKFVPRYVSFRSDGLLCISDWGNHCIHLVRDGRVIQRIGKRGSAPGEFWHPTGTAFTQQGDIIVCDSRNHRIQMYSL